MELYESEGLQIETIAYNDNQPLIDLVCRRDGLMGILDEEATLGRGTDQNWLAKFTKKHKDKPKILGYFAPNTTFVLQHFAGEVTYESSGFLIKNKNTLTDDLKLLMGSSESHLVRRL